MYSIGKNIFFLVEIKVYKQNLSIIKSERKKTNDNFSSTNDEIYQRKFRQKRALQIKFSKNFRNRFLPLLLI